MAKENLLPNLDLLLSLPQSFPVITHRHLQNSSVPKLPTYQLRSLRVTQYKRHRVMFFERRSFTNKRTQKGFDYRKKMMKVLCKKAKVRYFTFHCLRHYAASFMAKEHIPLTDIQKILGHQRVSTTDIYLRSLGDGVVEATKKLEAIAPPKSSPKP